MKIAPFSGSNWRTDTGVISRCGAIVEVGGLVGGMVGKFFVSDGNGNTSEVTGNIGESVNEGGSNGVLVGVTPFELQANITKNVTEKNKIPNFFM
ncbi:MAG: hypothetical protein OEZ02_14045 [Anaerolineae bacterium]|nr:hypothetical protein [Anaerolineae bacterium]